MKQPDRSNRTLPILVAHTYRKAGIAVTATVINAPIVTWVLWGVVPPVKLLIWLALSLLAAAARWMLIRKFRRAANRDAASKVWASALIAALALSGALWGASALFLLSVEPVAYQAFIALVIAGMVAGAVGVFSALLPAFLAFSIPALLPVAIGFARIGDKLHLAMAFMTLLFAILTFRTARHIRDSTMELVLLQESFADQLEQRTAELQAANTDLRAKEAQIAKSLAEKTMLLQEIHHRVKNNMQVIISLMHLQAVEIKDGKSQASFREASSRVNAMALIHNILYESGSISEVPLAEYFRRLSDSLRRMYNAQDVQIIVQAENRRLSMDQAIPCGLILNELISNSLKHAFGSCTGQIRIEVPPGNEGRCVLIVQDNGAGLPRDIDLDKADTLGLKLVQGLAVHQLGGSIEVDRSKTGACYRITFGCT